MSSSLQTESGSGMADIKDGRKSAYTDVPDKKGDLIND
jgi:hypothetical protein